MTWSPSRRSKLDKLKDALDGIPPKIPLKLRELTIEWINSIPKTINVNGCWIPIHNKPQLDGYINVMIRGARYRLHRLVLSIYRNLNYDDLSWSARHSKGCDKACFWIEHLQPGSSSDNAMDAIKDGTHFNANKECCPKCGNPYAEVTNKHGHGAGITQRYCRYCSMMRRRVKK